MHSPTVQASSTMPIKTAPRRIVSGVMDSSVSCAKMGDPTLCLGCCEWKRKLRAEED